jgi:hypothetical protein
MNPHRIRLGKPWQCEPVPEGMCWKRNFHRPTGLGPNERVWIAVDSIRSSGSVLLNGETLGRVPSGESRCRFEITGQLLLRNQIQIIQKGEGISLPRELDRSSPFGEVSLEIYSEEGKEEEAGG